MQSKEGVGMGEYMCVIVGGRESEQVCVCP